MANSIQNTPCKSWVLYCPPDAARDESTSEGKINNQPDYTTYSKPVEESNNNNSIPGVRLTCFLNKGEYDGNSQARITQWIDKVNDTPEPAPAILLFQGELLSLLPLVRQHEYFVILAAILACSLYICKFRSENR